MAHAHIDHLRLDPGHRIRRLALGQAVDGEIQIQLIVLGIVGAVIVAVVRPLGAERLERFFVGVVLVVVRAAVGIERVSGFKGLARGIA